MSTRATTESVQRRGHGLGGGAPAPPPSFLTLCLYVAPGPSPGPVPTLDFHVMAIQGLLLAPFSLPSSTPTGLPSQLLTFIRLGCGPK